MVYAGGALMDAKVELSHVFQFCAICMAVVSVFLVFLPIKFRLVDATPAPVLPFDGESLGLTASQHIEKIMQHAGSVTAPIFDYALINTGHISPLRLEQYAREGQEPIEADLDRVRELGVEPVTGNFVHEGDVLRHDYDLVAERLLALGLARSSPALAH